MGTERFSADAPVRSSIRIWQLGEVGIMSKESGLPERKFQMPITVTGYWIAQAKEKSWLTIK